MCVARAPHKAKRPRLATRAFLDLAERTGLEPATPGVTGRYSNQLNYRSAAVEASRQALQPAAKCRRTWHPVGDSNPCNYRERVVS